MGLLDTSIEVVFLLCDAGFKLHHIYLWKEKVFKRQPLGARIVFDAYRNLTLGEEKRDSPKSCVLIPIPGAGKQA